MMTFQVDKEQGVVDIEDIKKKLCPRTGRACTNRGSSCAADSHQLGSWEVVSSPKWYAPSSLADLFAIISANPGTSVRLVAGDTGRGVFKNPPIAGIYIDVKHIPDLYANKLSEKSLVVGSAIPLSALIELLETHKDSSPATFSQLAGHLSKVANVPVRNVGSWAGNLMLTHDYNDFPSDVFVMMAAVGATLSIANKSGTQTVSLWDFLAVDMSKSV
jgi:xanthine dehydrogenase/oxidase